MRTAEEIMNEYDTSKSEVWRSLAIRAINQARIEVIRECADEIEKDFLQGWDSKENIQQTILSLIDKVK